MKLISVTAKVSLVGDVTVHGDVRETKNEHSFGPSNAWVKNGVLTIDRPQVALRATVVSASSCCIKEADGVRCTPAIFKTTYTVADVEADGAFNSLISDEDGIYVDLTGGTPWSRPHWPQGQLV